MRKVYELIKLFFYLEKFQPSAIELTSSFAHESQNFMDM